MQRSIYLPEGALIHTEQNRKLTSSVESLVFAMETEEVIEGIALLCDASHNLVVDINGFRGIIPHFETAIGIEDGSTREIAVISRVGKPVSCIITGVNPANEDGFVLRLSRKRAQTRALSNIMANTAPGDILTARVTHLEPFGAFVDIGCGNISLIGIENLSVSRISHPADRLKIGQELFAAVLSIDHERARINLTHRELLGTWLENTKKFEIGETVRGIVRGVEEYGVFVELTPNLSGLAEYVGNLHVGDPVSVFIKSISPEKMKIKLIIISVFEPDSESIIKTSDYFITNGHIDKWQYSPEECLKKDISTDFSKAYRT